jgi:secreted trypsin-like serine protease
VYDKKHSLYDQAQNFHSDDLQFCAMANKRDSCKGDSGGPVLCLENHEIKLFGTVSFGGEECAKQGEAGFYGRISEVNHFYGKNFSSLIFFGVKIAQLSFLS